jgi:hypothetical protein
MLCGKDGTRGGLLMTDYAYDPSVDMSGYIPLNKRVHNACHCPKCRSSAWIRSCYKPDDFVLQVDLNGKVVGVP